MRTFAAIRFMLLIHTSFTSGFQSDIATLRPIASSVNTYFHAIEYFRCTFKRHL